MDRESFKSDYHRHIRMKVVFILVCIVISVVAMGFELSAGSFKIGFFEAFEIIYNHITGNIPTDYSGATKDDIVCRMYLPRAIAGLAVGAGFGICGAAMQSSLKNPLADPYTTGISAGASFGASLAIVLGFSVLSGVMGHAAIVINAFIFAMIPGVAIVAISHLKKSITPAAMILVGIAIMYIFTASTTFLKLTASEDSLAEVYKWSIGTLGKASWDNVWFMVAAFVFGIIMIQSAATKLNVLSMNDKGSIALGVDPKKVRVRMIAVVSIVTSFMVSFTGTIGFVGLVAPHVARLFIGSDNKYLIPASAMVGAVILLVSDVIAKSVGTGLPVGVVTAIVGGPLFIWLLIRQQKNAW